MDNEFVASVCHQLKERATFVKDMWLEGAYYFAAPTTYDEKTIRKKWKEETNYLDDPLFFMESIPSRETRWFIEKVLTKYWIYEDKIGIKSNSLRKLANGENHIY